MMRSAVSRTEQMLAAPVVSARLLRDDPDWAALSHPVLVLALAGAVALAAFTSRIAAPYNGVVAVTLPLTPRFGGILHEHHRAS